MKRIAQFAFMLLLSSQLAAQNSSEKVSEANQLFQQQKYDEANKIYRDALIDNPDSPIISFNIGDVQYKKGNYEEAFNEYGKALASDDILTQSKAYYNMGNTLYKLGKLPESLLHYKKALELNPHDEDAKYNLEFVRAKLKENSQQNQQNQQNQNQQNEQQQNQQQQGDQNQEQQNQNEQQQQNQKQEEQQQQQNAEQQQKQKNREQESENNQQQEPQAARPQEISKEDAERILNALKDEEEELLKQKKTQGKGPAFRGKDW